MPKSKRVVAEKSFNVVWQLPGYPGARLVSCGADIAALHFFKRAVDQVLAYGKVELTSCYESKEERGKFHFASTTRYLSLEMDLEQTAGAESIEANLIALPECTLTDSQEQKNEVRVEGVIRLEVPAVSEQFETVLAQAQESEQIPAALEQQGSMSPRSPFFPRGAESIPPIAWTMPERG